MFWWILSVLLVGAIALMIIIPVLWLAWMIIRFILNAIVFLICGEDELF